MSDEIVGKSFALDSAQSNSDHNNTIEDLIKEVKNLRIALREMKDEIIEDMSELTGLLIEHYQQVIAKHLNGSNTAKTDFDTQLSSESETESENESQELVNDETEISGDNGEDSNGWMIENEID